MTNIVTGNVKGKAVYGTFPYPKKKFDLKYELEIMKKVINERDAETRELIKKYPIVIKIYNFIYLICAIIIAIYCAGCGYTSHVNNVAEQKAEVVLASYQAEQEAIRQSELAAQLAAENTIEKQMEHNARIKAKIAYGSHNFIEKYNYSDADFMTLYQCIDNRLQHRNYPNTIDEIADMPNQWVGYAAENPVLDYYYRLAMKSEENKLNQTFSPVDSNKIYIVYTEHGMFLTDDPNAPGYTWWRYSE
jgi:hypothetical protein